MTKQARVLNDLLVRVKLEPTEINIQKLNDILRQYRRTMPVNKLASGMIISALRECDSSFNKNWGSKYTFNSTLTDIGLTKHEFCNDALTELELEVWGDMDDVAGDFYEMVQRNWSLAKMVRELSKLLKVHFAN